MTAHKVRSKSAKRSQEATQQAVKNILLDLFVTGMAETEGKIKNASYHYIEFALTTTVEKRSLDDVSHRSFERWTQSTSFVDPFNQQALNAPHFTRPVANFVKFQVEKTAKAWRKLAKAEVFHYQKIVPHGPNPPTFSLLLPKKRAGNTAVLFVKRKH